MQYLLCINSEGYELSLTVRKVYVWLDDKVAEKEDFVRLVDDTDEDYCFPASHFVAVEIPENASALFATSSHPASIAMETR
jgi:hypothetical protein